MVYPVLNKITLYLSFPYRYFRQLAFEVIRKECTLKGPGWYRC